MGTTFTTFLSFLQNRELYLLSDDLLAFMRLLNTDFYAVIKLLWVDLLAFLILQTFFLIIIIL